MFVQTMSFQGILSRKSCVTNVTLKRLVVLRSHSERLNDKMSQAGKYEVRFLTGLIMLKEKKPIDRPTCLAARSNLVLKGGILFALRRNSFHL